jgi:hypothetical protein
MDLPKKNKKTLSSFPKRLSKYNQVRYDYPEVDIVKMVGCN